MLIMPNSTFPMFVCGGPVHPDQFLDRKPELRTIFNRMRCSDYTAVVGEPHIGKSSLLLKLNDKATQRVYLGEETQYLTLYLDLQPVESNYTPSAFWEEVLDLLQEHPGHRTTKQQLERVAQDNYSRRSLVRLFKHLHQQGRRLVLLLDEFDCLLAHHNFQDPAFFGLLRSLSTTYGLVLVVASRLSVARMDEQGHKLLKAGSPFFNNMTNVQLRPFDQQAVDMLLDHELFSFDDRRFIQRVAGRHPYLLQAMAATLAETAGDQRQSRAAERFYERVSFHFDDLWRSLDDRTRTTAVILSLVELGGRALGKDFSCGDIEKADAFGPELQKLSSQGLAEQVGEGWQFDREHLLLWRGRKWTVGAQAFSWWVRDVVIAETRQVPTYDEWLNSKRYRFLLTQEQWDQLVNTVRGAPEWAVQGAGTLARMLFNELTRKSQ
jgi:hypothetical protein